MNYCQSISLELHLQTADHMINGKLASRNWLAVPIHTLITGMRSQKTLVMSRYHDQLNQGSFGGEYKTLDIDVPA